MYRREIILHFIMSFALTVVKFLLLYILTKYMAICSVSSLSHIASDSLLWSACALYSVFDFLLELSDSSSQVQAIACTPLQRDMIFLALE